MLELAVVRYTRLPCCQLFLDSLGTRVLWSSRGICGSSLEFGRHLRNVRRESVGYDILRLHEPKFVV